MISFYQLRLSSEPSVIGVTNGIQQVEIQDLRALGTSSRNEIVDFFAKDAMASEIILEPPFKPDFPCAKLLPKAIFTDFLSYGPFLPTCPFMVSEDAVTMLASFNLQVHRFYDIQVINGAAVKKFKLFYCPALGYGVLNFPTSLFYFGSALTGKKYLSFNSIEEYRNFKVSNPSVIVRAERLEFSSKFDDSLDLIVLKFGGVYVSSRLQSEISRLGLTGANLIPCFSEGAEGRFIHLRT